MGRDSEKSFTQLLKVGCGLKGITEALGAPYSRGILTPLQTLSWALLGCPEKDGELGSAQLEKGYSQEKREVLLEQKSKVNKEEYGERFKKDEECITLQSYIKHWLNFLFLKLEE